MIPFAITVSSEGNAVSNEATLVNFQCPSDRRILIHKIYANIVGTTAAYQLNTMNFSLGLYTSDPVGSAIVTPDFEVLNKWMLEDPGLTVATNDDAVTLTERMDLKYLRMNGEEYVFFSLNRDNAIVVDQDEKFAVRCSASSVEFKYTLSIEGEI